MTTIDIDDEDQVPEPGRTPGEEQAAPSWVPAELNEQLAELVKRAVAGQFTGVVAPLAKELVPGMLTGEVMVGITTAIEEAARALMAPPEPEPEPEPERPLVFQTVAEFVEGYLKNVFRRKVTGYSDGTRTAWCPEWWRHPEAKARLTALWLAWEHLRWGENVEQSVWWLQHADPHMGVLLDPENGPFVGCSARDGHQRELPPMPAVPAPAGIFTKAGEHAGERVTESGIVVPAPAPAVRRKVMELPDD